MKFTIELMDDLDYTIYQKVTSDALEIHRDKKSYYHPEGLFSEQIFGPVKDYQCQCGKYKGKEYTGTICEVCNVVVESSELRRKTFARIDLTDAGDVVVFNPLLLNLLSQFVKKYISYDIQKLLCNRSENILFALHKDTRVVEKLQIDNVEFPESTENVIYGSGGKFLKMCLDFWRKDDENLNEFLDQFEKYLYLKTILVIPPALRDMIVIDKHKRKVDDATMYYRKIIGQINALKESGGLYKMRLVPEAVLQKLVIDLYDYLMKKFGKKSGIMRHHILGKRVDYSGRGVIVVNPDLKLGYVRIPYSIAKEIFAPLILEDLASELNTTIYQIIADRVLDDERYIDVITKILNKRLIGTTVILNRQPTLHRPSIQSFKIERIVPNSDVIEIHPLVTTGFNADFDGDQMAMYVPMLRESIEEADSKMDVRVNSISPSNRQSLLDFKHEITLGFVQASINDLLKVVPSVLHKKLKDIKKGGHIDNKVVNSFVTDILKLDTLSMNERINIVDNLYRVCISSVKTSISLEDFYVPNLAKVEDRYNSRDMKQETDAIEKFKEEVKSGKRQSSAYDIIESGSRGNWGQFRQISIGKGYISDLFGTIQSTPVKHSLLEGLTQDEFFLAAYGSRKGIVDTTAQTSKSGYETRKLVYLLSSTFLDPDIDDCKTNKYLVLNIKDETFAAKLIGRYYEEEGKLYKITTGNYKSLVGKTINLRSPIYCKAKNGICRACYGELLKIHKSKQIGIIAAQSLGERMTQLVLRTFHTGGVASSSLKNLQLPENLVLRDDGLVSNQDGSLIITKDKYVFNFDDGTNFVMNQLDELEISDSLTKQDDKLYLFRANEVILVLKNKNKDIISDLSVVRSYLSAKYPELSPEEFVLRLSSVFDNYGKLDLVHFELVAQALMFDPQGNPYRTSDDDKFMWVSIQKALENNSGIIHNLAFERFKMKLNKYLSSASFANTRDALTEQLLTFHFDERDVEVDDNISDLVE